MTPEEILAEQDARHEETILIPVPPEEVERLRLESDAKFASERAEIYERAYREIEKRVEQVEAELLTMLDYAALIRLALTTLDVDPHELLPERPDLFCALYEAKTGVAVTVEQAGEMVLSEKEPCYGEEISIDPNDDTSWPEKGKSVLFHRRNGTWVVAHRDSERKTWWMFLSQVSNLDYFGWMPLPK